jgi:hypothetical protein
VERIENGNPGGYSELRGACLGRLPGAVALLSGAISGAFPFHAAHVRSAKAVNSDNVNGREADRSTGRSVRGQSGGGLGGISSEDEGLASDPLESGKGPAHTFESAVVGSDQWYRERAEDQAKEMELRRKLRICAC